MGVEFCSRWLGVRILRNALDEMDFVLELLLFMYTFSCWHRAKIRQSPCWHGVFMGSFSPLSGNTKDFLGEPRNLGFLLSYLVNGNQNYQVELFV